MEQHNSCKSFQALVRFINTDVFSVRVNVKKCSRPFLGAALTNQFACAQTLSSEPRHHLLQDMLMARAFLLNCKCSYCQAKHVFPSKLQYMLYYPHCRWCNYFTIHLLIIIIIILFIYLGFLEFKDLGDRSWLLSDISAKETVVSHTHVWSSFYWCFSWMHTLIYSSPIYYYNIL